MRNVERAFVINLDRRPERMKGFWERVPPELEKTIERVSAVDGTMLTPTPELISLFRNNDFSYRRNIMGCSLSHYGIWRRLSDEVTHSSWTAVFEDDAWFNRRFLSLWNDEMSWHVPESCDLIYIGGVEGPTSTEELAQIFELTKGHIELPTEIYAKSFVNKYFAKPVKTGYTTCAYLISRSGAEKLCAAIAEGGMQRSIDFYLIEHWDMLGACVTVPPLCWAVLREGSDIQYDFTTLFGGQP